MAAAMFLSTAQILCRDTHKRLPQLDGLRGLAIIAVYLVHRWPDSVPGGWVGVDLFFVLSGYLITGLLVRELDQYGQIDLAAFAARRGLRIIPALLAMLIVDSLFAYVATPSPQHEISVATLAMLFVTNWIRAFSAYAEGPLGHTWSLSMEEQFYLIWPFALMLMRRHRAAWTVVMIGVVVCWRAVLAGAGADPERTYNGYDTHTDGLLLGCLLALCPPPAVLVRLAARWVALPLALLTAIIVAVSYKSALVQIFGMSACAGACAWLLVAALEPGITARTLSLAPLRGLGRLSYSLYLWHLPIMRHGPDYVRPGWTGDAILLTVTFAAAFASFYAVERPFLRLRGLLPQRAPSFSAEAGLG